MFEAQETWMAQGSCRHHLQLGWIKGPTEVGLGEMATMEVVCARCPVFGECAAFVSREHITSGCWAGAHRDTDTAEDSYGGAA
jgi:hypothetical protein